MTPQNYGVAEEFGDGIRRVLAPNPGPMTYHGTNTWLVGEKEVAVIDPGPESDEHLAALLEATQGQTISHILVTHAHADHSPLARKLSDISGAPVYGFGSATSGRSAVMRHLSETIGIGGGEGVDAAFAPDIEIGEGDKIAGDGWTLGVLHTPGHFAGHLSFKLGDTLFSGDHVMDWSTTLVSPPDGDVGAFMATCERLVALAPARCLTGHGDPIAEPADRLSELMAHRRKRETEILDALKAGIDTIDRLTSTIYREIPENLLPAASRNVMAHLIDLTERKIIHANPRISLTANYRLNSTR